MPLIAVLLGGLIGTGLRLGVDALVPHAAFPWSTLLANTVGSFVLALLVARVWPVAPEWLRVGLGAGVLGSFTTFSAVAVSFVSLVGAPDATGGWALALAYVGATLAAGLGAAWAGLTLGRRPAGAGRGAPRVRREVPPEATE